MYNALPIAGIQRRFTSRDQLRDFFHAVATASFPLAKSVIFNGSTRAGKSLGWDTFREALMDKPKLSDEIFAKDDLSDWRISELWEGFNKIDGKPLRVLNFGANLTDYIAEENVREKLEQIEQATFDDDTLERLDIERPIIEPPADIILMSNSGYGSASMRFTIYEASERNEFGKPPRYVPWQRDVTWEILDPQIADLPAVKKVLATPCTP